MIEIEIQNFQSIDKVAFRIEGFTVLVGRSNIGKSALVRAIQCALTGATGTDFVRHGLGCERRAKGVKKCKCKASVHFKTGALDLLWEKGDGDNQYTVAKDGGPAVTYTAVNRGTPDFLLPDFAQVLIGDTSEFIQVSEQFEPIFLLKKSGSVVADVLSDVAKLDDINVAMKLVGADRREAVSTRNVRDKDIDQLKKDLESYTDLNSTTQRAQRVQERYDSIHELELGVAYADQLLTALRELANSIRSLTKATSSIVPDGAHLLKLGREHKVLCGYVDEVAKVKPVVQRLVGLDKIKLPESKIIQEEVSLISKLGTWLHKHTVLHTVVSKTLGKIPEPDPTPVKPVMNASKTLNGWASRHERLTKLVVQLEERLSTATEEEDVVLQEFDALGLCPTCALPLHIERRQEEARV